MLLRYDVQVAANSNNSFVALKMMQKDKKQPERCLCVAAIIPEDRILVKWYQLPGFGVYVPKKDIDLKYGGSQVPTKPRIEYLKQIINFSETIALAYVKFKSFLALEDIVIFLGRFGARFDSEVYEGFYAFNLKEEKIMFFRNDTEVQAPYRLHSFMKLAS